MSVLSSWIRLFCPVVWHQMNVWKYAVSFGHDTVHHDWCVKLSQAKLEAQEALYREIELRLVSKEEAS
jgi:hypothetical protein